MVYYYLVASQLSLTWQGNVLQVIMAHFEHNLAILASILKLILESISLLCILVGLLKTAQVAFFAPRRSVRNSLVMTNVRINFGRWLSLALEFQLAADIVNTTVAPSLEALGKLGALAVIRTFLNYFLNKELTEELTLIQERQSATEDDSKTTIE